MDGVVDEEEGALYAAPLLMTKRLLLAAPGKAHADQIVTLANNRRVAEMLATMPHPFGRKHALDWIDRSRRAADPIPRRFALFRRDEPDTLIGSCGAGSFEEPGEISLGFWIGEPFWGHGYATEAAQTVVDYVFELTDLVHISCSCRVINPASRRVIQKCGFQYRDNIMVHSAGAGGLVAAERYALDRRTWQSLKAWSENGEARHGAA